MPSVSIAQPVLLSLLNRVTPFSMARSTIPILECVKLEIAGRFSAQATDLDMQASATTSEAIIEGEGSICFFSRRLREIVRLCDPGAMIEMAWTGLDISLKSGPATFTLKGISAEDFPKIAQGDITHRFSLPVDDARLLFKKPAFAISTEETRYYLNGIYLHGFEGKLRAVAADGHRLALADVAAPPGSEGMPGVIVPRATVARIGQLAELPGLNGLHFSVSAKTVTIEIGGTSIISRLIDGDYPDYHRVIPKEFKTRISAASRHFSGAVRRAKSCLSSRNSAIKVSTGDNGIATISGTDPDYGSVSERVPVDGNGGSLIFGMNARYFLSCLAAHGDSDISIECTDPGSPIRITGAPGLTVIQMPMRI